MTARVCRVAVTGVGLVSALGLDAAETFRRVVAGERGFGPLGLFDGRGQRTAIVAEVSGLRVADIASGQQPLAWSRSDAMAVIAAREAMVRSGPRMPGERLGAVLGVTTGGMYEAEEVLRAARFRRPLEGSLEPLISYPLSATARRVSECVPGVCRTVTVSSACSSGAAAVVQAAIWLERGHVDRVIAGGADALSLLTLTGFNALGATDPEACRPFDARRAGLTLGEGAAFVALETEARARERGASVLALLAGWALGAEAHHLTQPEPSGATAAGLMRAALHRAGLRPQDIDYVNAHGTGTIHNDAMEARALREVFGPAIGRVFVSSSKGQLGHTLGAAGAIEAVITVLALSGGEVPPTGGLQTPDPDAKLRHVVGTGCRAPIRAAFSSSFGFGGTGCVVVFVRPDQTGPEEPEIGHAASPEVHSPRPQGVRASSGGRSHRTDSRDPIKSEREQDRSRLPERVSPPSQARCGASTAGQLSGRAREPVVTAVVAVSAEGIEKNAGVLQLVSSSKPRHLRKAPEAQDPITTLDPSRSRRFDRAAAFVTLGVQAALGEAHLESTRVGLAAGCAFGNAVRTIDFLARVVDRGPRFANPAEFPHLLPSSASGNASIYLGIKGPVVSVPELDTSAEAALAVACDWIRSGMVDEVVSGSAQPHDEFIAETLSPLCGCRPGGVRSEGAAWLVVESGASARRRGVAVLARLPAHGQCQPGAGSPLRDLPAPCDAARALVVVCGDLRRCKALLAGSAWLNVETRQLVGTSGRHEAAGAYALAAAAVLISNGDAAEVLALAHGVQQVRWSLFCRPTHRELPAQTGR